MSSDTNKAETRTGPRRFGPSARALKQRRWLVLIYKSIMLACVIVATSNYQPQDKSLALLIWLVAAGLAVWLWMVQGAAVLDPIRKKQVLLHEAALELSKGEYRRFVVFEGLKHVQAVQNGGEQIIEIKLHTADDSLLIRDVEGLGEIFAALCAAKPAGVLVEVEERRVDWGEPLPWVLTLGLLTLLLYGLRIMASEAL